MPSLDLLQRHLLVTAAIAGLLLGGVIGLFFPIRAAAPPKVGNEAWALPTIAETKRFHDDDYGSLRTARFWKTVATPGQRGTPKLDWKLTAIITRPRPMAAIDRIGSAPRVDRGASPASHLIAVGGELPDGSTLVRLTRDSVWFEKDGCVRERRLYRAVTPENNACIGEAAADTTGPVPPTTPSATTPTAPTPSAKTPTAPTPSAPAPAIASPRSDPDPAPPAPSAPAAPQAAETATP